MGYFRIFIRKYSELTSKLYGVIAKKVEFYENIENEVNEIRKMNIKSRALYLPDFKFLFILENIASKKGVRVTLIQKIDEENNIFSFVGRKFVGAEINYSKT